MDFRSQTRRRRANRKSVAKRRRPQIGEITKAKLMATSCPSTLAVRWMPALVESSRSREPEMTTRSLSLEAPRKLAGSAMACMAPARGLRSDLRRRVSRRDSSPLLQTLPRVPGRHRRQRLERAGVPLRDRRGGPPGHIRHHLREASIGKLQVSGSRRGLSI